MIRRTILIPGMEDGDVMEFRLADEAPVHDDGYCPICGAPENRTEIDQRMGASVGCAMLIISFVLGCLCGTFCWR